MQLDKNTISKMLSLDDASLWQAITLIAKESGFDLSNKAMRPEDIAKLRTALSGASEEDIRKAAQQLEAHKKRTEGKR